MYSVTWRLYPILTGLLLCNTSSLSTSCPIKSVVSISSHFIQPTEYFEQADLCTVALSKIKTSLFSQDRSILI